MDADVKRKISRAKLPPPLIKPKFQPLIQFCQGLSIRYAITFVSDPPTLQFSDFCVSLLKDNVTQAQETKPGKIDNVWQKPGNSLKTRFDSDSENHPSLSSAFILPNHKVFKSLLNCSRVPQPTLRRLLKSGGNLSKSIAIYILNLIYKQPLTTSVMRGGGWMTAIINLAIIFTFIDQQRG